MTREKLAEIFNETQEKFLKEELCQEKISEAISRYSDENGKISPTQLAIFSYIEGFKNSANFMWEIMKNLVEHEEQQKEEPEDM